MHFKFVWLFSVRSTTSEEVIKCLTKLFNLFGFPERISDRGTAFTSHDFAHFLDGKKNKTY